MNKMTFAKMVVNLAILFGIAATAATIFAVRAKAEQGCTHFSCSNDNGCDLGCICATAAEYGLTCN
jgi:hypothetical protein